MLRELPKLISVLGATIHSTGSGSEPCGSRETRSATHWESRSSEPREGGCAGAPSNHTLTRGGAHRGSRAPGAHPNFFPLEGPFGRTVVVAETAVAVTAMVK
jgi:hypothetical protein